MQTDATVGRLALLCLSAALAALGTQRAGAQAQQEPPSFTSEVELITVDAVVLDGEGRAVPGLTRDDFVVKEDGSVLDIVSFEAFAAPEAPPAAATPGRLASNEATAARIGRAFAILLDDVALTASEAASARSAAVSFLEKSVRDGDEVTLGTTSGEAWWSARLPEGRDDLLAVLARVKGRFTDPKGLEQMTDFEAYTITERESFGGAMTQRVVARWVRADLCPDTGRGPAPSCPAIVRGRAVDLDGVRKARTRIALAGVRRALDALAPIRGRKSLIFLSRGFLEDTASDLRDVSAASREANTAVYFINARGLVGLPGFTNAGEAAAPEAALLGTMTFEDTVLDSAGAQDLADDTGGFSIRNTNDLAAGADRIAAESRVFYLLGFHPPPGESSGAWRKLRVEVNRKGLSVRARRGYTLRPASAVADQKAGKKAKGKPALDPAVARALDSAGQSSGIPLRATAYAFEPKGKDTAYVQVAVEFDVSRVALRPKAGKREGHLDLSVVVTHRDSGRAFRNDSAFELSLKEKDEPGWRALVRDFELPPGASQARVVVRDATSGAVGSVSYRFEVPPLSGLHLSTPILTDRVEEAPKGSGAPRPAMSVVRTFKPGGRVYCQFEVFGAAAASGKGTPRVTAAVAVRAQNGRLVLDAPATPITPATDGRLVRLVGMDVGGWETGDYEMQLVVQDEANGARVERREPFTLASESASH